MADNSLEIIEPLDNHPCDTPRGCTYYDRRFLTDCQQLKLNQLKLAAIKSAERYLQKNPEIRGFVALITRHVFRQQPRRNVPKVIEEYFQRPRKAIEEELEEYLRSRPPMEPEELFLEEESVYTPEDFDRYLAAMQPVVEEAPDAQPVSKREDPSAFIREMLVEHVEQLPCFELRSVLEKQRSHHEHTHYDGNSRDDSKPYRSETRLIDIKRSKSRRGVSILQVSGSEGSMMKKLEIDLKKRGLDSKHLIATDDSNLLKGSVSSSPDSFGGEDLSPDKDVEKKVEKIEESVGIDDVETVEEVVAQEGVNEEQDDAHKLIEEEQDEKQDNDEEEEY